MDEYHRLGEAGILGEDDRVELLNGDLITMAPIGGEHRTMVDSLTLLFATRAGNDRYRIAIQNPISLDLHSEPQPDVVLYAASVRGRHPLPQEIFLLIEVADSSLAYDLGPKLTAYARGGIREVWVIDVIRHRVVVNRQPAGESYQERFETAVGETLFVEAFPDISVSVDTLMN